MTPARDKSSQQAPPLLIDAVFGGQRDKGRGGLAVLAVIAAIALHASLWLLSQLSAPSLETWSARMAAMVHHDLNASAPTAIETLKLPEPEPEPEPEPPPTPKAPAAAVPPPPRAAAPITPPPSATPAQASQIIAAANDAPADLTADTFITGTASAYAGGATTTRGESTTKVDAIAPTDTTANGKSTSVAQPVSLTSGQWQCPWPAAALAQDLYEQFVIVRAWVREDGSVERASVVSEPGYGFGAAAMTCALRTRFNPARNARGEAVRSLSPPIRVRFTR
jgi:protein TonB